MSLFKPTRKDVIYQMAMGAMESVMAFISLKNESGKDLDITKQMFHKIFPNDSKSPSIYWLEGKGDEYVIYYPPYSRPYAHSFEDKCKFITCLSGKIYDKNSNLKLFKNDKLTVYPKDNYAPHTMEDSCYLLVKIENCK